MVNKKTILDFIKKNEFLVLATASLTGKPEAAVMVYVVKDDFSFIFCTDPGTRKYKNIAENKQVSLVIGGWKDDPTVQIDGLIRELNSQEGALAKEYILSVHPEWCEHFSSPTDKFFEIKPTWLRYGDFSQNPPEILEIQDF